MGTVVTSDMDVYENIVRFREQCATINYDNDHMNFIGLFCRVASAKRI